MMIKLIYKSSVMLLLCSGLMISSASAAKLPSWYPDPNVFQNLGTVDSMARLKGKIVVNDQEYQLPMGVLVHTPGKKNAGLLSVREGKLVAITSDNGNSEQRPKVTEIWVLPPNYVLPAD